MFKKNIEAIKVKNPALAEKLEKIELDSIKDIIVTEAESGDLILGYKEVALHNTIDPLREAKALWNKTVKSDLKKNDVQLVFGLGLGYLFKRAYVNSNSKIFLVEPFVDVLRFVLEHVDFSAELSDERVYITDNVADIAVKLTKEYLQGDKTEFLYLPAYTSLAQNVLEELTKKTVEVMEEKSSDTNTIFKLAPLWTNNFILNIPYFQKARPLGFFKDAFVDKTALIISAGPSLKENIEKIKENQDKFVTIAVGRVFKTLVDNDIIPDFITFADAQSPSAHVKGYEEILEKTNLIITSKTEYVVTWLKAKNKILYLPETDLFVKLFPYDAGIYKSASSVSIINYFIAKALGFNNIAFVGLDLAFPDNKIYSTGEKLDVDENGYIKMDGVGAKERKLVYTKDKDGNDIPTRDDYSLFIRQFEEVFEEETSLSKVINTSTKGAYIKGMEYVEFDKFMENLEELNINIDEVINSVNNATEEKWSKILDDVFNRVYSENNELKSLKDMSKLIINDIQDVIDKLEKDEDVNDSLDDLRSRTIDARNRIMKSLILQNALQGSLWAYAKNYITDNLYAKETIINNLKTEKILFESVYEWSEGLMKCLEISSSKYVVKAS